LPSPRSEGATITSIEEEDEEEDEPQGVVTWNDFTVTAPPSAEVAWLKMP